MYVFSITSSLALLLVIVSRLRSKKYRERHAVIWIFAGVTALFLSIFPEVLTWISRTLGFALPTNFLFFVSIILLFLVTMQTSSELTILEEKTRKLAEKHSILTMQVEKLEAHLTSISKKTK